MTLREYINPTEKEAHPELLEYAQEWRAAPDGKACANRAGAAGWYCTLRSDHPGFHVAQGIQPYYIIATWDREDVE